MKFDLDPTVPRVVMIAILLFAGAFMVPAHAILTTNRMPTPIEWLTFVFAATIEVIIFLMAFIKGEET